LLLLLAIIAAISLVVMTYLTVPIAAQDLVRAKQQIKAATAAGAEMLELRTDYLERLNVDLVEKLVVETKTIAGKSKPIIVTCRDSRQGGAIEYPEQLRVGVLTAGLKAGAEFIDFEYENFLSAENKERIGQALSESSKGRLILSAHNFETKFTNITKLFHHITTVCPGAIPKLAYTVNHINDCFDAFDLLHGTSGERIVFCMGEAGFVSRIIAKKLDSLVTFASVDEKTVTASGQLTIERFKKLYRYDSIDSETELYGLIGSPVAHSAGPAVHNACFADKGMNKLYLPLLVEGGKVEFDSFLDNILSRKWLNFRGFSVTIPHKQNALNYVRGKQGFIEPLAERIGAVNTLVISEDGQLSAYNTDYAGAMKAITSALKITKADFKKMPVAVIGAGGAARAVVAGLADAGAKITIYNRTVERGERLAAEFNCDFAPLDDLPSVEAKLLINSTSIGMYPDIEATPMPKEYLKKEMAVFDTVYNPPETLLLKGAKEAGAKTISGLDMFVNQAMGQFKLFTGQDANIDFMREVITRNITT
jgi:3-dehydroquinate dehydratase/shikimate dehydrogenase